jgi:thiamine kinase-like enzyme
VAPLLTDLLDRVAVLRGRQCRVDEIPGGLTNRAYRVRTDDGGDYVVRVPVGAGRLEGVDRDHERHNMGIAAAVGVAPSVVDGLPELGVLVVGFVPGRTLVADDLANPAVLARVTPQLRRLHAGPPFRGWFDLAGVRGRYLRQAERHGVRLPSGFHELADRVAELETALRLQEEPGVACHNDLVAANLIDDGDRVWLVDFEYAATNVASADLGNLAACADLGPEGTAELVTFYYDAAPTPRQLARVEAWALLSAYSWTAWACARQEPQDPWANRQFESARAGLLGAQYANILDGLADGG